MLGIPAEVDGKWIFVIVVRTGQQRPYKSPEHVTSKKEKKYNYYIRYQTSSVKANSEQERELINMSDQTPFDCRANHKATFEDISPVLLEDHLRKTGSSEKVSFINARGKKTIINPSAEVVPLVVFENNSISEYEHLLRNHTNDGLAVNCMSIDDFKLMCKQLLSPREIIEYLKWREAFYKKNGPINLLITETNNGFVLSKPQKNENLVQQYLYEKYGENAIYEDRLYYELFRQYVSVLYEHKQMESEINGCYEVIKFLEHLFRDEIKCFVERTEKALLIAKTKRFNLVGTLHNVQKEYAIVFTATEQGEQIPSEKLLPVVFEKQKVHTLLQIITYYWMN